LVSKLIYSNKISRITSCSVELMFGFLLRVRGKVSSVQYLLSLNIEYIYYKYNFTKLLYTRKSYKRQIIVQNFEAQKSNNTNIIIYKTYKH